MRMIHVRHVVIYEIFVFFFSLLFACVHLFVSPFLRCVMLLDAVHLRSHCSAIHLPREKYHTYVFCIISNNAKMQDG